MSIQWDIDAVWKRVCTDGEIMVAARTNPKLLTQLTKRFGERKGRCFSLAHRLSAAYPDRYLYIEGLAGKKQPHAWICDREYPDFIFDLCWNWKGNRKYTLEKCLYLGIKFDPIVAAYMQYTIYQKYLANNIPIPEGGLSILSDDHFLRTGQMADKSVADEWFRDVARKYYAIKR